MHLRRLVSIVAVALLTLPPSTPAQAQTCTFELGFATLRSLITSSAGDLVGQCLEQERFNPANGNAEQRATGGLLVWRKCDNWTAFTNGSTTWLNGPAGLASRPNAGPLLPFEASACPETPLTAQPPTVPTSTPTPRPAPPPPPPPTPTPSPPPAAAVPVDRPPEFSLRFPPKVSPNLFFQVEIQASDDYGLRYIAWRAEGTRDQSLKETRVADCRGSTSCSFTWWASTDEDDDFDIVAEVVDTAGQLTTGSSPVEVEELDDDAECDSSYPDLCIPSPPPDLDCEDIPYVNFTVRGDDPHRLDDDDDGLGCG